MRKEMLARLLCEITGAKGVYERNDVPVRRHEGLEMQTGLLLGEVPDRVEMVENGILYHVDVKHGQKTGFFLDQKQNRAAIAPLCPGARVLDLSLIHICSTSGSSSAGILAISTASVVLTMPWSAVITSSVSSVSYTHLPPARSLCRAAPDPAESTRTCGCARWWSRRAACSQSMSPINCNFPAHPGVVFPNGQARSYAFQFPGIPGSDCSNLSKV